MPTQKFELTGIENSITDGLEQGTNLHGFFIDKYGGAARMPIFQNTLVHHPIQKIPYQSTIPPIQFERFVAIKHFFTYQAIHEYGAYYVDKTKTTVKVKSKKLFKRWAYSTTERFGCFNTFFDNIQLSKDQTHDLFGDGFLPFREFAVNIHRYKKMNKEYDDIIDTSFSLNFGIGIQQNLPFFSKNVERGEMPQAIIASTYMEHDKKDYNIAGMEPKIPIKISTDATDPKIEYLEIKQEDEGHGPFDENDYVFTGEKIANRFVFFSKRWNAVLLSGPDEPTIMGDDDDEPYTIIPEASVNHMVVFNGNLFLFTASGTMERWVLSSDEKSLLEKDPTFEVEIFCLGAFVYKKILYFVSEDRHVFSMDGSFQISQISDGLMFNECIPDFSFFDDTVAGGFEAGGYDFIYFGLWMFCITTGSWSTYSLGGFKKVLERYPKDKYHILLPDTDVLRMFTASHGGLVCSYISVMKPLNYKQSINRIQEKKLDLSEGPQMIEKYNWCDYGILTTRLFQEDQTITVTGVQVLVRGYIQNGAKMWLQILPGSKKSTYIEDKPETFGVEATYQEGQISPDFNEKKENGSSYRGYFRWEGINTICRKFRVQLITKEPLLVIDSVLFNYDI